MARPRKYTSTITKYRMNRGWQTPDFAEAAQISYSSVTKVENSEPITRPIVAKYLRLLEMDLNDPSTLPAGWEIVDKGEKVVLLSN